MLLNLILVNYKILNKLFKSDVIGCDFWLNKWNLFKLNNNLFFILNKLKYRLWFLLMILCMFFIIFYYSVNFFVL